MTDKILIDRETVVQSLETLQRSPWKNWRVDRSIDSLTAALTKAEPTGWQKIETAPKDRTMFVVRGFNVAVRKDYHYDTDPYCVWATGDGFKRWPHPFKPTHWMPLPAAPKDTP